MEARLAGTAARAGRVLGNGEERRERQTMNKLLEFAEDPRQAPWMIAGWQQWADAGDVSSGLPRYLIDQTSGVKLGEIKPDGFYLFQIPGAHHLLRPVVKLSGGHRVSMQQRKNEFYYAGEDRSRFVVFLGEEPHQNEDAYADAFFDAAELLGVRRIAALGGVHASVPYDRERDISCVYSLPHMRAELERYAVRFSEYEGGATITTLLADRAEARGIEFFSFYVFVPAYDLSQDSVIGHQVAIEEDAKAWYDVTRRLDHMFNLGLELSHLAKRSAQLVAEWDSKVRHLEKAMPQLGIREYLGKVEEDFEERHFLPYGDLLERELADILQDL